MVKRPGSVVFIAVAAGTLLMGAIVAIASLAFRAPAGPPLVARDVQSGKPFELDVVSNGNGMRVWLDLACDECAFPIEGDLELSGGGKALESVEISAGDTRDRGWGGHSRSLERHLLFDADPQSAGQTLRLKGTLTVPAARGATGAPIPDSKGPIVRTLRVSITN